MDAQIQTFLDNLMKSQFADLKGSWGNFHLELSEKVLNDLGKLLLTQKGVIPYLALVNAVQVKGAVSVDLKLNI